MTHLVSTENIELFETMRQGLERTLSKTSTGKYWTIEALLECIKNKTVYGFRQESSGYMGAMFISNTPLQRALEVFWGGKDINNKTPIDFQELDTFYVNCAKYFGCDSIIVSGRKGWKDLIDPYGYHEDSRVYIKEV